LKREANARKRRQSKKDPSVSSSGQAENEATGRRPKMLNLQTYKVHALGDYVATIKRFGTTDSYTSEIVSYLSTFL
jgi:hypothetical protein